MGLIIVGGVVKKDNKYLLVQESKDICRGKWNLTAGKLDPNENIFEGAKREIKEESGFDVELTGIVQIANRVYTDNEFLAIIFSTNFISGEIKYNPDELLDVKWFTYDEIINMQDQLRSPDLITEAISAVENNKITNIDVINIIK